MGGAGNKDVMAAVESLEIKLKRRLVIGSFACAIETLKVMRSIVSHGRWTSLESLLLLVRTTGLRLVRSQPIEFTVGNVVRKVLHCIRDEHAELLRSDPSYSGGVTSGSSLYNNLLNQPPPTTTTTTPHSNVSQLRPIVLESIKELMDEFSLIYLNISNQAIDHIHSSEIIMTFGKSKTVEEFLKSAYRKRKFQVIVAECSPLYSGQQLAVSLSQAGIETTVISDSAIYAVLSRVNKVILGTHAVLANGGLIAVSGSQMIVAAAKYHHVPVVVCTGMYKLSALMPYDVDLFGLCVGGDCILRWESFSEVATSNHVASASCTADSHFSSEVDVVNPYFDYVAPDYISLFVTNTGGHSPSYIYRLLSENYHLEDYRLEDVSQPFDQESTPTDRGSVVESPAGLDIVAESDSSE